MNEHDQRRAEILARLASGSLTCEQASTLLGIGERQVRRLRAQYQSDGIASVVHGNRERTPPNKTDPLLVQQLAALAGKDGRYEGTSVSHLCDLLAEREQIVIARSTLDRLLKQTGTRKPKGRGRESRRRFQRRERQPSEGMLIQIDGSPHTWLEKRGPSLCLMGAVDDATGKILYLHFHKTECQAGYLMMIREIALRYGLPIAYYHDRHTILRSPKKTTIDDELAGQEPMSQVQRVMHELGVESIGALSPQAKGRVERLWGTLQQRLVAEMRIDGICTLEEANAYLPAFILRYNARFSVAPAAPEEPAWVPIPVDFDLIRHFSTQEWRSVKSDQTIRYFGQTFRIEGKRSFAGERVAVHETPEGQIAIYGKGGGGKGGGGLVAKTELCFTEHHPKDRKDRSAVSVDQKTRERLTVAAEALTAAALADRAAAEARRDRWLYGPQTRAIERDATDEQLASRTLAAVEGGHFR